MNECVWVRAFVRVSVRVDARSVRVDVRSVRVDVEECAWCVSDVSGFAVRELSATLLPAPLLLRVQLNKLIDLTVSPRHGNRGLSLMVTALPLITTAISSSSETPGVCLIIVGSTWTTSWENVSSPLSAPTTLSAVSRAIGAETFKVYASLVSRVGAPS